MELTEEECYCDIVDFYNLLAVKSGIDPNGIKYNCMKISVTEPVRQKIFAFYMEQVGAHESETAMVWLFSGPKADLECEGYFVKIEDGFFVRESV